MPGLTSNNEIVWEYIDQNESEYLYYEIFVNKSYFTGLTLSEGDLVVDAGANIGLFSMYCLTNLNKNLKICAFEPITPIFEVLERNLKGYFQNKNNLKLFNLALGSKNEKNQLFYYFPTAPGESTRNIQERNLQKYRIERSIRKDPHPLTQEIVPSFEATHHHHKRKISDVDSYDLNNHTGAELHSVNTVTLPTVMRQVYGDNWYIDLLKVDVEGDEWNVLEGLVTSEDRPSKPLTSHIRQIVLEVHDQPLHTASLITHRNGRLAHIVEFLEYHGYTVNVEQQLPRVCEGTDYYMYIPPELNLYYVYAIHNETSKVIQLNDNGTTSRNNNTISNNNNNNNNNNITINSLTNEDFDALLAVLDDSNVDFDSNAIQLDA